MKLIYSILLSLISLVTYSQHNIDQSDVRNFTINGATLIFVKNKINSFEKVVGKLNVANNDNAIVPFVGKPVREILENDKISIYLLGNEGYIKYLDLEKSSLILNYKTKTKFSSATTLKEFRKVFPKSYKSPSYIPGTPPEKAVGYTVIINRNKQKAYLNFAFYYNKLVSIMVSNEYSEITK